MKCQDLEDLLSASVDDELNSREALVLERHLQSCRACRRKARLLEAMKSGVRRSAAPPFPADARQALLAAAREADARRPAPKAPAASVPVWLLRPAGLGTMAGAFAALAIGVVVLRSQAQVIRVDDLLAAHDAYALTMPLAQSEQITPRLAERLAGGAR